ncbi:glycosyltransferase family 4 protein [Myxosarcina sp. GI1]|uniref:glycosyltransferase family 4 protein n=1 Tax=Myxosarcina sp. GI1 TaxID=1541065 RepID=UPI000564C69B|nr:glycosyltransferase [Myxosarcina sp. GI1]
MDKLIVLPGSCGLGGTTVSLSMMVRGFEKLGSSDRLCLLVRSGSLLEQYLRQTVRGDCLQVIPGENGQQFFNMAFKWIAQQPPGSPLLLENCTARELLSSIALATPQLRLSRRPVYHLFRDLARSYNPLGNTFRKLIFTGLAPEAICNSRFTAENIDCLPAGVRHILHPAVDTEKFNHLPSDDPPPINLQPILATGARIILTPSRISEPDNFNDKNLRGLIPMLARLKASGGRYHGVVIGPDYSPGQSRTQVLLQEAQRLGVADRFTILPPTFAIEEYYKCADAVVTLAPREPFGRTVVEAIACGIPVIGSNTGGIGEILQNFAPEWTVDSNDPIAAAEAVLRLQADCDRTNRLLELGNNWVVAQCNSVEYAKKLMDIVGFDAPTKLPETALVQPLDSTN